MVCVCVSQFVSERSAILLVLLIKLTKETRGRDWRGRDRDGEIGKRQIVEGGCEESFLCLSLNWEACRFTVPPVVALLNYISSNILWRIFCQTGIFTGFSLYIFNNAVRNSEAAMGGAGDIIFIILTPKGSKKAWPPRLTPQNDGYVNIINMHVCNTTNS